MNSEDYIWNSWVYSGYFENVVHFRLQETLFWLVLYVGEIALL